MFSEGTEYTILIDHGDQNITHDNLEEFEETIQSKTNNGLEILFKQ